MKEISFGWCAVMALMLAYASTSLAASTLTISSSGSGAFILQGTGIENAAAVEITVSYDSSSLANPRVTQGALMSGALMAVNANVAGMIRIAMVTVHPVSGSGPIATLVFDRAGSSPGRILSLNVKLANLNGQQLSAVVQVVNPVDGPAAAATQENTPPPAATTPQTAAAPAPVQPPIPGGIILVPQAGTAPQPGTAVPEVPGTKEPTGDAERPNEPGIAVGKVEPRSDPATGSKVRKVHAHTSVLDRFREFKGTTSMAKYLSFFEQDTLLGFRQEPLVALSDGKSKARVTFISVPGDRNPSEAALAGARLISLARDPDYSNTWSAEIQPAKGEFSASLSIPQGKIIVLYPVTVAPGVNIDLDKSGSITKADFDLFLNDRGSPRAARFDLNGDGKRDYIDDYIFTANYIAARGPH